MESITYKNYRIFFNEYTKKFCLAEIKYDEKGQPTGIPNPLVVLGSTIGETKEQLEALLSDVEHAEKEVLGIDKYFYSV